MDWAIFGILVAILIAMLGFGIRFAYLLGDLSRAVKNHGRRINNVEKPIKTLEKGCPLLSEYKENKDWLGFKSGKRGYLGRESFCIPCI